MTGFLATVGYEGHTQESFIALLGAHAIALVIDVRAETRSRKPGFSRTKLSLALADGGIGYCHMPALGTPAAGREAARRGERAAFEASMKAQLATPEAKAALDDLADLAGRWPVALMCLERDPQRCHRSLIAAALAPRLDQPVVHLGLDAPVSSSGRRHPH